ncbi:MAG: YdeI/OmpD-associated family protein [Methanocellales archaeon]|nr:YdeI/OmpD-associated family protein [Methanocellales archaeon]MDD3290994.1 YdeI/OmpD-associated family protein [Methanocellales archaeon]MDD5234879.1 YdeI/OmpD-associated family protein [Methanocellales archaeon]MDD5484751.1 YdeI/OmpD-associated family protein [Methanocellales archaeon]
MELGKKLYVTNRNDWRSWLAKNYDKEKEIWLIYYRKSSGKQRIPYNDAVEEALCYGWIDSNLKGIDEEKFAQRFTPRKPKSKLSEMNKERVLRLIEQDKMTFIGLASIEHVFDTNQKNKKLTIAPDILKTLKQDNEVWKNFQKFPDPYKRIRIGWVEGARTRPKLFNQRLNYFLKMTAKDKKYGKVQ